MSQTTVILVPGAWMGGWIWEPTIDRLRAEGVAASTLTLSGVDHRREVEASTVTLADHVAEVRRLVESTAGEVVLVGHSYSSMVTAQVADQIPDRVRRQVHFGGFLPADGRSLLDDWGDSAEAREEEARTIASSGNLWLAPTREALGHEPDLSDADRDLLASRFTDHPGSTITDPARLTTPVGEQRATTYVALAPNDETDAWSQAPQAAQAASGWERRFIRSGHWPMLSQPDTVVTILLEAAQHRHDDS